LVKEATVRKSRTVQFEGDRQVERNLVHYNLDMIISLGYRVHSKIATNFRRWATERLKEYIIKGFTIINLKMIFDKKYQIIRCVFIGELMDRFYT